MMTTKPKNPHVIVADMIAELEAKIRPLEAQLWPLQTKISVLRDAQVLMGGAVPDAAEAAEDSTETMIRPKRLKPVVVLRKGRRQRKAVVDRPTQREFVLRLLEDRGHAGMKIATITSRVNGSGNGWAPTSVSATMSTMKGPKHNLVWVDANGYYKLTEAGLRAAARLAKRQVIDTPKEPDKEVSPATPAVSVSEPSQVQRNANW